MHINVHDFLVESIGYSQSYKIAGERPHLHEVRLTQDIEGDITIVRLETNLLVQGHISAAIELECHRCLRTFSRPVTASFKQIYAEDPSDDELPISDDTIDLAPLIEQEIILNLPIKILCTPDCTGIAEVSEQYTAEVKGNRLSDHAHIKKGINHGRTKET